MSEDARPFLATYRLQLGRDLDFERARSLLPYLRDLGISHLYLSPVMQARAGSTHAYDVTDPTLVSGALGGEARLRSLAADAHSAGLGIVLDFVPNHMAISDDNPFWRDAREQFFDIDPTTGFHRRFFDVDDLAGVRVEDPEVFAATHVKLLELVADGVVDGVRVDHVDGLADPAEYLTRLRGAGVRHVWVEKILETGETLRAWPIEGTTGYEFLNEAMRVFVDSDAEATFTDLAGETRPFALLAYEAQLEQAETTFAREVDRLRRVDDPGPIEEALARLPVYRTYVEPYTGRVHDLDRQALAEVPSPLREVLSLEAPTPGEFVTRFQQTSGAIMAKGVEDTAFYRYVRLLALNEVGGDPGCFGLPTEAFHRAAARRLHTTPTALLAAQTHDTKRSLDVRSRLVALTGVAGEWVTRVHEWQDLNARFRVDGAPDWTEELLLYQTLVGAWPITSDRLERYLVKAMRERKCTTSWVTPEEDWEKKVLAFADAVVTSTDFLESFEPFAASIAVAGERVSLSQVVLRFTTPGVPDIYQGDELWDLSLVDPDNRRTVDWRLRRHALAGLRNGESPTRETAKLFVIDQLLALRSRQSEAFARSYEPIDQTNRRALMFGRGGDVIVAVPLGRGPAEAPLPSGQWRNLLTPLAQLYENPPAVFEREWS